MEGRALIESAQGDTEAALSRMLSELRIGEHVHQDSRVAIKPNFTYPFYKEGVTTSPSVLEATVRVLTGYTKHIRIVESDGGSAAWSAEQAFAGHNVPEICRKYGVTALGLTQQPRTLARTLVDGREIEIDLPAVLLEETDFFITLPVPKVHAITGVSLGFKNQWGCIPDVKRLKHHPDFVLKVIAINRLLHTRVAVFDGTWFLDRNGPMQGHPVRRDLLVVGEVGVATRAVCELMGVDPMSIPHKRLAIAQGMMPAQLSADQVNVPLEPLRQQFHLKRTLLNFVALGIFHNQFATNLLYDSKLAKPAHDLLYLIRGRPKDIRPAW